MNTPVQNEQVGSVKVKENHNDTKKKDNNEDDEDEYSNAVYKMMCLPSENVKAMRDGELLRKRQFYNDTHDILPREQTDVDYKMNNLQQFR